MKTAAADPRRLFDACLTLPPGERAAYLDAACGADTLLRARIEALLAAHDVANDVPTGGMVSYGLDAAPPDRIGPYRLVERIGAGGMGEVWIGRQEQPVRRQVAIKLVKAGMDTREVIARFQAERQALALMNHPNIARIIDADATEGGRPYFVMEYVPGQPITGYCDAKALGIDARIRLFIGVCDAVQHAHQKGVIHRDLKPSNVLVTEDDGQPQVKVIDFGIAKATDETRLAALATPATRIGDVMGTPGYMSPEQAGAVASDLDTRTDVYSLGAVLYELLCGAVPLEFGAARHDVAEVRRIVREAEPARPSARFADDDGEARARQRGDGSAALREQLRGELDWIVLKALEKDRAKRYDSVDALAGDLARYLADEPVTARPPDAAYRLGKYLRLHRALVLGTAAVLVGIALTAFGFGVQLAAERDIARADAARATAMADFLFAMFDSTDPNAPEWNQIELTAARSLLARGLQRIDTELAGQPGAQARLLGKIGEVFVTLGDARHSDYERGRELLLRAVDLLRQVNGPDDLEAYDFAINIAYAYQQQGDLARADTLLTEIHRILHEGRHRRTSTHGMASTYLGSVLQEKRDYAGAEQLYRHAMAVYAALGDQQHNDYSVPLDNLAGLYYVQNRTAESIALSREVVEFVRRHSSPRSLRLATALGSLAGRLPAEDPEGEALVREAIAIKVASFGSDFKRLVPNYYELSRRQRKLGRHAEAVASAKESVRIARLTFDAQHPMLPSININLIYALIDAGQASEAAPLAEAVWSDLARQPRDVPNKASAGIALGVVRTAQGRYREAERLLLDTVGQVAPPHRDRNDAAAYRHACRRLAELYQRTGTPERARPWLACAATPVS